MNPAKADAWAGLLIAEFSCVGAVMAQSADAQTRVTGSRDAARWLQAASELNRMALRERAAAAPILGNAPEVLAYLRAAHAFAPDECLRALFLTARHMLLKDELVWAGSLDQAPFWPRIILRRCLELNAAAIILVHNHPSGDHAPSRMDVETTARFIGSARCMEIDVHDHLIFSSTGHSSLRTLGLI